MTRLPVPFPTNSTSRSPTEGDSCGSEFAVDAPQDDKTIAQMAKYVQASKERRDHLPILNSSKPVGRRISALYRTRLSTPISAAALNRAEPELVDNIGLPEI